jgi:enamine deaminase RidA (YjgF/YER057c/UK114 family)
MSINWVMANPAQGFADAVAVNGPGQWVHVSGNVGFDDSGAVAAGGLGAESRATFDNIERVLAGLGGNLSHIVKITAFVTDLSDYAAYAAVREERFGVRPPASSTVQVAGLLVGASIEIEAIAFIPTE